MSDIFKGDNLSETVTSLNEKLQKNYELILNSYLMDTLDSFEFDENSLNCILEGDRDQFYAYFFHFFKIQSFISFFFLKINSINLFINIFLKIL